MIYNLNLESQQESIFNIINNKTLCLRNAPCFKFKVTWSGEHFPSSYSWKYSINFTWSSIRKPRSSSLSETTSTKHTMNNDMFISTMPEWFGMNPYLYVSLCKKLTPPPPHIVFQSYPLGSWFKNKLEDASIQLFLHVWDYFFQEYHSSMFYKFLEKYFIKICAQTILKIYKENGERGQYFFFGVITH